MIRCCIALVRRLIYRRALSGLALFLSACIIIFIKPHHNIPGDCVEDNELLQELKRIRKLLEPKPAPPAPRGFLQEFKVFLDQYKVMGLAVAFIFGIYLGNLVQALVNDLIMPLIDVVMPGVAWQTIAMGPFLIGSFTGTLITFLIIAAVIFLIIKFTSKLGFK